MNRIALAGIATVAVAELVAFAVLDRRLVVVVTGVMVALVLVTVRSYFGRDVDMSTGLAAHDPGESLRRWLSRTETLVSRAESTRRDWDRHMRPMLARQFEMATGQRQAKDRMAFEATGRMLFGAQLWAWVDPQNIARTDGNEPGPGRDALSEILRCLEGV